MTTFIKLTASQILEKDFYDLSNNSRAAEITQAMEDYGKIIEWQTLQKAVDVCEAQAVKWEKYIEGGAATASMLSHLRMARILKKAFLDLIIKLMEENKSERNKT